MSGRIRAGLVPCLAQSILYSPDLNLVDRLVPLLLRGALLFLRPHSTGLCRRWALGVLRAGVPECRAAPGLAGLCFLEIQKR